MGYLLEFASGSTKFSFNFVLSKGASCDNGGVGEQER
jgi:hypothetical protein